MNWNIAGHKNQIEFLSNSIKNNKLSHAYLFAGPAGVGKRTVSHKFAQALLCENGNSCNECGQCKAIAAHSNADFIELGQEEIKIEHIRDLSYKLSLKSYLAKYKVAVIDNADTMTTEAGNALLKLLEEPKPNTVIILISANPFRLLRTISSRLQKINFGLVKKEDYDALLPANLTPTQKEWCESLAFGKPGLAIKISSEPEYLEKLNSMNEQYERFNGLDIVERLKLAYEIADLETADIQFVLDGWTSKLQQDLLTKPELKTSFKLSKIIQARRFLDQNVNCKLMLSDLMLSV